MHLYAAILAGGSGTRFWPKSRTRLSKQFLSLHGTQSLLQNTVTRIAPLLPPQHTLIVTAAHQQAQTAEQLTDIPEGNILAEPLGRNTAAAIAWAACYLLHLDAEALMVVLPADHAIVDQQAFCASLQQAVAVVQAHDVLMTLGVQPTYAATGYGYIKVGDPLPAPAVPDAHRVVQFTEKPHADVAAAMLASGQYLWNCGIFVWKAATIAQEIRQHLPDLWQGIQAYSTMVQAGASREALYHQYAQLPSVSVDNGVLEHSARVGVLPVTWGWSDVGSWRALADLHPADNAGNVVVGQHLGRDTTGLVIYSPDKLVATIGLSNLIVVHTDDVLLICDRERDQEIRELVAMLQQQGRTEYL
jgi:mannose-1-phosphate guanylyltransferase